MRCAVTDVYDAMYDLSRRMGLLGVAITLSRQSSSELAYFIQEHFYL